MSYIHPENRLDIVDGSLRPVNTVPSDVVLIIERAHSGPANTLYLVQDLNNASRLFGANSPLITLANQARAGGARNIGLFRIGGGAFEYNDLFGPNSYIGLTEQSRTAARNVKVYIGPEPKNATRQCVIVYDGDRIIYSDVLGAEVRTGRVIVAGFDKQKNKIRIGTAQAPVDFTKLKENMAETATVSSVQVQKGEVDGNGEHYYVNVSDITSFRTGTDNLEHLTITKTGTTSQIAYTLSDAKDKVILGKYVDGNEFVKESDTVEIIYSKKLDDQDSKVKAVVYKAGKDSLQANYKELYEQLDQALELLELVPTKAVVVGDLFGQVSVAQGAKSEGALEYLLKGEDEEGYATYQWSKHPKIYLKQGTQNEETTDISQAELDLTGKPIVLRKYGEVDFLHRLGMFAYYKLQEGNYINIICGAISPTTFTPRAINDWIGVAPRRDVRGNIVQDGTGLLGHRLMVGSTTYPGGYFATADGFVDGVPLTDPTGFAVDLGKHISIVASQVTAMNGGPIVSGAAAYAGIVANLTAGNSTTNKRVETLFLAFDIKESKRKELAEAGYVVFQDKTKGLTVYSGELATRENSDFDYISTAITISEVSRLITEITDPFLGQGLDLVLRSALNTQLQTALANAQRQGWFISYQFDIRRGGPNELLIPYVIEAKDELRRVSHIVRLTRDDSELQ